MAVTESRQQQLLAGQSSIARKVFVHIPIQDCWSVHDIHGAALTANATTVSAHAIRRALFELKDAGIIREPVSGKYQRDAFTPKLIRDPVMTKPASSTVVAIKKPEVGALDALAALSGEVVGLSEEIGLRMKKLAARIEEVALSVATEQEGNAEALGKLKQLQSLLKGIAQ